MEPLTPIGRMSLAPEHNHVIHCAIGLKNPINLDTLKDEISKSILTKVPRFSSLLVLHPYDGTQFWQKTQVNIEDHICIHDDDDDDDDVYHHDGDEEAHASEDDIINSYLADIAISPPMSLDKPLWEVHVMPSHKCLVMRVHHALADGVSIMSMLWTIGRSRGELHDDVDDGHHRIMPNNMNGHGHYDGVSKKSTKSLKEKGFWEILVYFWFTLFFGLKFLTRCLWVKDKVQEISGIEGVEFWPRKVATARFNLSDMKIIKRVIPNATIHDVLYGVVWCGLTKYMSVRFPQVLQHGGEITGMCPINLREQSGLQDLYTLLTNPKSSWGNKLSIILLPIRFNKHDLQPLAYVAKAKAVMEQKRRSMEARFSYDVVNLGSTLLGPKFASSSCYKLFRNTTFLLSNIAGPQEQISIAGNPVTFIRLTSSAQPQAITMHMVSYKGKTELQIQVAKEVIPDPKFLAKCFEDALLSMKEAAEEKHAP